MAFIKHHLLRHKFTLQRFTSFQQSLRGSAPTRPSDAGPFLDKNCSFCKIVFLFNTWDPTNHTLFDRTYPFRQNKGAPLPNLHPPPPRPRNKVLHVCRLLFNHTIINDSIIHLLFIQDFWERLSQIKCKASMLFSSSFSFRCSRVCCIPFSRDQPHSRGCVLECFLLVWLLSLLVFCR